MKIYLDTKHMKHVARIEEMLADEARCNCNFGNTDYEIIADDNENNWIDKCDTMIGTPILYKILSLVE